MALTDDASYAYTAWIAKLNLAQLRYTLGRIEWEIEDVGAAGVLFGLLPLYAKRRFILDRIRVLEAMSENEAA